MNQPRIEVAQVVTRFIAGAGGVALRGAENLDPARYHVTIVTGLGGHLLDRARRAGMDAVVEPSLVAPISPRNDAIALGRLVRLFRQRRFDVVHTHSAKAGALGRTAAHHAHVPAVVHTFHGFPFHEFQAPLRRYGYIRLERQLAQVTDCVLAVGTGVASEALRRGLARPEALRTIAPAIDTGGTGGSRPLSPPQARALLGLRTGVPVVGTVGRLDYQKAPDDLVRALALMHDRRVEVVWIGDGPLREQTRQLAASLGVGDRVHLAGHRDDVPSVLPALDVFAMASRYEGLPCAMAEAMQAGLPVVATAVNSMTDLVVPGETGLLVPPGRPDLLASALDHLVALPAERERLAARGRTRVGEAFSGPELSRVLDEVYLAALTSTPDRPADSRRRTDTPWPAGLHRRDTLVEQR